MCERKNKFDNESDHLKIQPKPVLNKFLSEDIERAQRYRPSFHQMIVDDSDDSDNSNCSSVSKNCQQESEKLFNLNANSNIWE